MKKPLVFLLGGLAFALSSLWALLLAAVLASVLMFVGMFFLFSPPRQGADEVKKSFDANKADIQLIVDNLVLSEFEYFDISSDLGELKVRAGHEYASVSLDNEEFEAAVSRLFDKKGYKSITKSAGVIEFIIWSNKDCSIGLAYSIDGHEPDNSSIYFLTETEKINEDGWYYYKADFNEFKRRDTMNSQ